MVAVKKKEAPYNLDPGFERAVVWSACSSQKFYGRIGYALNPELLGLPPAKLALEGARAIAQDAGVGPGSTLVLLQRLRNWQAEGKVKHADIVAVCELFDDAEDYGVPSEDLMIAELVPMLQQRMRDQAVMAAMADFGQKGDLQRTIDIETKAQRLGQVDTSLGIIVGEDAFADVQSLSQLERLPTGVPELDHSLDGGLQRAGLGMVIAESGGGKSIFLSHMGGWSTLNGLVVCQATLELPRPIVLARTIACMTNIPINAILDPQGTGMKDAKDKLAAMGAGVGTCIVQDFPAQGTTMADIDAWVSECEQHLGRKVDLLVVDYIDKMTATGVKKDVGSYEMGKHTAEQMRAFADSKRIFCWTGCQATRNKKGKRLDLSDAADSMNKPRIADLVLTLNPEEEGEMMRFFVAKHRTGRSRFEVGPLPTDFVVGRIAPVLLDDVP